VPLRLFVDNIIRLIHLKALLELDGKHSFWIWADGNVIELFAEANKFLFDRLMSKNGVLRLGSRTFN
jgi:hypothetical protein